MLTNFSCRLSLPLANPLTQVLLSPMYSIHCIYNLISSSCFWSTSILSVTVRYQLCDSDVPSVVFSQDKWPTYFHFHFSLFTVYPVSFIAVDFLIVLFCILSFFFILNTLYVPEFPSLTSFFVAPLISVF